MGLAASQARLLTLNNRMLDLGFESQKITNGKIRLMQQSNQIAQNLQDKLSDKVFINTDNNKEITANMLTGFQTMGNKEPQKILKNSTGLIVVSADTAQKFKGASDFEGFLNAFGYTSVNPENPLDNNGGGGTISMPPITQNTIGNETSAITSSIDNIYTTFCNAFDEFMTISQLEEEAILTLVNCLTLAHTSENDDAIQDATATLDDLDLQKHSTAQMLAGIEIMIQAFEALKTYYYNLNEQCQENGINIDSFSGNFTNFETFIAQLNAKYWEFDAALTVAKEAHEEALQYGEAYGWARYRAIYEYPNDPSYQAAANTAYQNWMTATNATRTANNNLITIKNDLLGIISNNIQPLINNLNISFTEGARPEVPEGPASPDTPNATYTYDIPHISYYGNIFNEMLKGYISVSDENFNDEIWLHDQIKAGNIHIEQYSEKANNGQGGFLETSIEQDSLLYEEYYEKNDAAAQAEYDRKLAEIHYKDKRLDLQLKNIETEYNANKEEFDSVKKTQGSGIERIFKTLG